MEYAIVYLFDSDGNYIGNLHELAGKTSEIELGKSSQMLKVLLDSLGKLNYKNIEVKPFSIIINGIQFGLIPDDETQSIELQPCSTIAFFEPWNGEYDT